MLPKIVTAALLGVAVAACSGNPQTGTGPRENTGTLVGALAGAAVGSQIGGGSAERVGAALAGAAIGGLIGNRIGAAMDDEDKQRAYAAQVQALESGPSGAPVAWRNPDSGHYGSIVPGPTFDRSGAKCRQYTHTVYIGGRPETARGTACRNADGTWTAMG